MSTIVFLYFAFVGLQGNPAKVPTAAPTIVTARQVNGTWRSGRNEFRIWALGQQKLRVEFSGSYRYKNPGGMMVNVGEGAGIASIEGDTATFKPEGVEGECKITMKFTNGKLIAEQEGGCDFGLNVTAAGTYRKVSGQKPKFETSKSGRLIGIGR